MKEREFYVARIVQILNSIKNNDILEQIYIFANSKKNLGLGIYSHPPNKSIDKTNERSV